MKIKINSSNNLLKGFKAIFLCTMYLLSYNSFSSKPIFKFIYLRKLVSAEQSWSPIRTNTPLLVEIWSQYKLWIFKIHCPSQIPLFFVRKFLA